MENHEGKSFRTFLKYYGIPLVDLEKHSGISRSTIYLDFERNAIDRDHRGAFLNAIKKEFLAYISEREGREVDPEIIDNKFVFRFSPKALSGELDRTKAQLDTCIGEKGQLMEQIKAQAVQIIELQSQVSKLTDLLTKAMK